MTNQVIKFPLEFKAGLGYSPNSGPPVGGAPSNPGKGFWGQSMASILPNGSNPTSDLHFFGRIIKRPMKMKMKSKKRKSIHKLRFGSYPLMNLPNPTIDMSTFPKPPIGPGDTPGGDGGNWFPTLPTTSQYWGYGSKKIKNKKRFKSRKMCKARKSKKRSLKKKVCLK